ncbi:AMP-binding protein, partial [Actinoalloteichus spitiensis]|uniref:AMP-binding protein n=1 Tax=Actinoalloteichus spitiensis TaxID=252394 RepID=UPI0012F6276A
MDLDPAARVFQFVSPSFDVAVADVLMSLAAGATVVLPTAARSDGTELVEMLRAERISHAMLPAVLLAAAPDTEVETLRTVVSGGEALGADTAARWARGRRFLNGYGPSETT